MKPRILVPCRRHDFYGKTREGDCVHLPYLEGVHQAGAVPFLAPLVDDIASIRSLYEMADGVLLTGGEDIDPKHYGSDPHKQLGATDPRRDAVEIPLVRWATEDHKPLFGICRGMQMINVALGGSLYQDLPSDLGVDHAPTSDVSPWERFVHWISIVPDTRLARFLGCEAVEVNSIHHQAVREVSPLLKVAAISRDDGVIEAIESKNGHPFLLGVQCHPEGLFARADTRWTGCFRGLVEAAKEFSAVRS